MAYSGNQTGGDADQRRNEAESLLEMIGDDLERLTADQQRFILDMRERFAQYGSHTFVTGPQIFWLRDIKDRLL